MGDDDKATKKKPPKPKLPGKKPPKSDKEATEKYKAAADFLDCKGTTLSLKPGKLDWLGLDITPSATFEQDKTKPGTINIKVELPLGSITLPTSVKDGKLNVDASSLPIGADDVKEFVDGFNAWLEANGNKLGGATLKDGAVTLTKESVAVAPEKELKGGLLPHVPAWEKVGAVGLLAVGVAFGVGFINAGDETKTVSAATGNQVATAGTPNLYKAVTTVRVTPPGRSPVDAAATSGRRVETVLPLFVKSPHRVELVNVQGKPVDSFVLEVPNDEGTVKGSTERGGTFDCFVNHRQGVNGSGSSGRCAVQPPAGNAAPATNAGAANTAEAGRTTETKEGKPWSLLAIPGVMLFAGGGLVLDEERRRRNGDENSGDEGDGDDEGYGEAIPVGGPDDDGIPPPKLEDVQAKNKAVAAQRKAERAFTLRWVLDQIKDVNAGRPYKDIVGANCSFCALATESTLAGHPATAPPKPLYPTPVKWWREYALKTWGQVPGTYKSVDDVTKVLDIWGDGNRGILLMSRPDGTGHAINVVNMGGHVLYVDGQSGKEFTNFGGYSEFVLIRTTN